MLCRQFELITISYHLFIVLCLIADNHDDVMPTTSTSDIEEVTVRQRETGGGKEDKEREEKNGERAQSSDFNSSDLPSFQTRKQDLINAARK